MFSKVFTTKVFFDAAMLEPEFLGLALQFYSAVAQWLTKLACGCDEDAETPDLSAINLPLPMPPPIKFAFLPEHFAEDVCEFLMLTHRYAPRVLENAESSVNSILTLFILLLESPGYVRNPYLRGKFVDLMSQLLPEQQQQRNGEEREDFSNLFNENPLSKRYLTAALIRVYVDFENTGGHNQFHDKFPVRNNVYLLLEHLCDPSGKKKVEYKYKPDPAYKESLFSYLKSGELAPKFTSLLLSDTIYNLEEGLMMLKEVKKNQDEQDSGAWDSETEDARAEKEKHLKQIEGNTRWYMGAIDHTIHLLQYVTVDCAEPFLVPEMVDRMAGMMNSFIVKLVGPEMGAMKVRDMEAVHFNPKQVPPDHPTAPVCVRPIILPFRSREPLT